MGKNYEQGNNETPYKRIKRSKIGSTECSYPCENYCHNSMAYENGTCHMSMYPYETWCEYELEIHCLLGCYGDMTRCIQGGTGFGGVCQGVDGELMYPCDEQFAGLPFE